MAVYKNRSIHNSRSESDVFVELEPCEVVLNQKGVHGNDVIVLDNEDALQLINVLQEHLGKDIKKRIEEACDDLQNRMKSMHERNGKEFVYPGSAHITSLIMLHLGFRINTLAEADLRTWLPKDE